VEPFEATLYSWVAGRLKPNIELAGVTDCTRLKSV